MRCPTCSANCASRASLLRFIQAPTHVEHATQGHTTHLMKSLTQDAKRLQHDLKQDTKTLEHDSTHTKQCSEEQSKQSVHHWPPFSYTMAPPMTNNKKMSNSNSRTNKTMHIGSQNAMVTSATSNCSPGDLRKNSSENGPDDGWQTPKHSSTSNISTAGLCAADVCHKVTNVTSS